MSLTALLLTLLLAPAAPAPADGPAWYAGSYNTALRDARVGDQLVLLALLPEWSDYSRQVDQETFADPRVVAATADLVCVRYTQDDAKLRQVSRLFNIENYPALVFVDGKGRVEDLVEGFIPAEPLLEQLARITAGVGTVGDHQARVDEAPDDLDRQHALLTMLRNVRDWSRAEQVAAAIRQADPEAQTPAGSRLAREALWQQVWAAAEHDGGTPDLAPVLEHVESRAEPRTRFEGWNEVANTLAGQGDAHGARHAFHTAWTAMDGEPSGSWAASVASWMLNDESAELSHDERAFTLALAEFAVSATEQTCEAGEACKDGACIAEGCGLSEEQHDSYAAERLALLASAQLTCAPHDQAATLAAATLERCVALAPESHEYRAMLDELVARR